MYFDFEDSRPDTPRIDRALTTREGVMGTIIVHMAVLILILLGPKLPFFQAMEERRLQAIEEQRRLEEERLREKARFVFMRPREDIQAPKPPPVAELSDIDRRARTVERAPNPTNRMPFSRGNSPERMEAERAANEATRRPEPAQPAPEPTPPESDPNALTLPDAPHAEPRPEAVPKTEPRGPAVGVLAEAIRNVRRYAQTETFRNLGGGSDQEQNAAIQFDSKGVEFGPWLARFVAQVRRNWFIPMAAMTMRGHVVVTFFVHKDGRITDVSVLKPSSIDAFTLSARNAILTSNPTQPLPPEYPDDRAFFTVTFYFNENPSRDQSSR
jgi:TonB family protein